MTQLYGCNRLTVKTLVRRTCGYRTKMAQPHPMFALDHVFRSSCQRTDDVRQKTAQHHPLSTSRARIFRKIRTIATDSAVWLTQRQTAEPGYVVSRCCPASCGEIRYLSRRHPRLPHPATPTVLSLNPRPASPISRLDLPNAAGSLFCLSSLRHDGFRSRKRRSFAGSLIRFIATP